MDVRRTVSSTSTTNEAERLLASVPMLPEIVERLVRRFDPLQIILFGSWARGDTHRWSDVDLLVVLPDAPDKRRAAIDMRRALAGVGISKDIVVTDRDEIEERGDLIGTVLRPALREGRVVYERPPAYP